MPLSAPGLAGYEPWGKQIARIAVIARPAHRGQGYGIEAVIVRGMLGQCRTLRASSPSLRLGAPLGFGPLAEALAARL